MHSFLVSILYLFVFLDDYIEESFKLHRAYKGVRAVWVFFSILLEFEDQSKHLSTQLKSNPKLTSDTNTFQHQVISKSYKFWKSEQKH